MGPLASMPGGREGVGPLAPMSGGREEIAMLDGDNGHSAVDLAFRLALLLHTKASSSNAQEHPASSAVCTLRLRLWSLNRCMANRNCNKRSLSVLTLGDVMDTDMKLIKSLAWPQAGCCCCCC